MKDLSKWIILGTLGIVIMLAAVKLSPAQEASGTQSAPQSAPNAANDPVAQQVAQQIGQLMIANAQCQNQNKSLAQDASAKLSALQSKLSEALKLCGEKCTKVGETTGETKLTPPKP